MREDNFVHVKRERKKGKGHGKNGQRQQNNAAGGFYSDGHHNKDQREGNFSFDTIHGLKLKEVEYTVPSKAERVARGQNLTAFVMKTAMSLLKVFGPNF